MKTNLATITLLGLFVWPQALAATAAPDVSGKVVLANLHRYDAHLRFGKTRRAIKPKKASILSPKTYPVTVEYWSGNTKAGWRKFEITKAGVFGLNFQRGYWTLAELKNGTTKRTSPPPTKTVIRQRIVKQPVRRLPINADRYRWSPLARASYAASRIYQFVRDEEDRDLLRHLLIRAREDEDLDRLEDWLRDSEKIAIPHKEELRDIFRELAELKDEDWKEIDTADERDWEQAKADLGDLVSEEDWTNLDADYAEIDTADFWEDDLEVDLDQIEFADLDVDGGFDIGDDLDLSDNVDLSDLEVDTEHFDLGGYDDFDGYDGAYDVDPGDFDGGYFGDDDFGDFGGFDDFDF